MNNSQVAHLWAQQSKPNGKGSNFYFEGPTIYSYGSHFPIATFTDKRDANGEQIVLFTTDSYGQATSKHISYTRRALSNDVRVLHVPHLTNDSRNVTDYAQRFETAILKASRARTTAEYYISDAQQLQSDAADYCRAYGHDLPESLQVEISPELIASAKARAADAAKRDKALNLERAATRAKLEAQDRDDWRAGGNCRYFDNPTMLRVMGDTVETSRGAIVPLDDARILWRSVMLCKLGNRAYSVPPGDALAVGEFTLRSIRADGTAIVGCHEIPYSESERVAIAQGWN